MPLTLLHNQQTIVLFITWFSSYHLNLVNRLNEEISLTFSIQSAASPTSRINNTASADFQELFSLWIMKFTRHKFRSGSTSSLSFINKKQRIEPARWEGWKTTKEMVKSVECQVNEGDEDDKDEKNEHRHPSADLRYSWAMATKDGSTDNSRRRSKSEIRNHRKDENWNFTATQTDPSTTPALLLALNVNFLVFSSPQTKLMMIKSQREANKVGKRRRMLQQPAAVWEIRAIENEHPIRDSILTQCVLPCCACNATAIFTLSSFSALLPSAFCCVHDENNSSLAAFLKITNLNGFVRISHKEEKKGKINFRSRLEFLSRERKQPGAMAHERERKRRTKLSLHRFSVCCLVVVAGYSQTLNNKAAKNVKRFHEKSSRSPWIMFVW